MTRQLPSTPPTADKQTRDWMEAVGEKLRGLLTGSNRAATVRELARAGIIAETGSGAVSNPNGTSRNPPALAGLTAAGALDNIFLSWTLPVFSDFGSVEVWRSDSDDIGSAFLVGTSQTTGYTDAIGAGAVKYYWVRIKAKSGSVGPFNSSAGTMGRTGRNPTYVMDVLTHRTWAASTSYLTFQYVRPSTPNGKQYLCISAGTSAPVEPPAWPTVAGQTVVDGSVTWRCEEATAMVPFVIGTIDGNPAVGMHGAFIEDATIGNAKIREVSADKITTGELSVGRKIQVGGHIWSGYDGFREDETGGAAGWFLGMVGSSPRFQLSTAGDPASGDPTSETYTPPTYKRFTFDGSRFELLNIDLISSTDGEFDDLSVDTLSGRRVVADIGTFTAMLVPSDKIDEENYGADDEEYYDYLCYNQEVRKTVSDTYTGDIGNAVWMPSPAELETAANTVLVPYDHPDADTYYRFRGQSIAFSMMFDGSFANAFYTAGGKTQYLRFQILDQDDTVRFDLELDSVAYETYTGDYEATTTSGDTLTVTLERSSDQRKILLTCDDDGGLLGYIAGREFRAKAYFLYATDDGASVQYTTGTSGYLELKFQMIALPREDVESDDALSV